jgi:hypothetical protein
MRRKLEEDVDSVADGSSLLARVLEVEYVVDSVEAVAVLDGVEEVVPVGVAPGSVLETR